MIVGDPKDLYKIDGFEQEYFENCRKSRINHKGFIGPQDKFSFTCERTNVCCKNFSDEDRIVLEPYDILRLSRKLRISTGKFISDYADLSLDRNTQLPIALLGFQGTDSRNKCIFLRSYGCSVYEDRPLRCRLYPLGRLFDKGKSYYILINNCPCGDTKGDSSWTAREWIESSDAEDFLEYQEYIAEVFSYVNLDIYRRLDEDQKISLGRTLHDIDAFVASIPEKSRSKDDKEIMISLKYWATGFFMERGCLKSDYKSKQKLKFVSRAIPKDIIDESSKKTIKETATQLI